MPLPSAPVFIIVIGDEVLTAKVRDANGPYLLERLAKVGAQVRELRIISDEIDVIAATVRQALDLRCNVITTGGVGPTHDDRTMEAVAKALGLPLQIHPELEAILLARIPGDTPAPPLLRMCRVPLGATLVGSDAPGFPAVLAERVLILPGIPALVQDKFPRIEELYKGQGKSCGAIFIDLWESRIAPHLDAQLQTMPDITIGSYPRVGATGFRVIVTVEHKDPARVSAALDELTESLGHEYVKLRELPFSGLRNALEATTPT